MVITILLIKDALRLKFEVVILPKVFAWKIILIFYPANMEAPHLKACNLCPFWTSYLNFREYSKVKGVTNRMILAKVAYRIFQIWVLSCMSLTVHVKQRDVHYGAKNHESYQCFEQLEIIRHS